VDLVRFRAEQHPARRAYVFLGKGDSEQQELTFGDLDDLARAHAARLQDEIAAGDRVLLLYPPGLEFVSAFLGCLYAGAVAVPAYPPRVNRNDSRIPCIARDARAAIVLTTDAVSSAMQRRGMDPELAPLRWLATDGIDRALAREWRDPGVKPEDLAFLQYTSGSTAAPKGVMVSHGNLMENERVIQSVLSHDEESTFVGWLPVYHDMGLIANVLQPLYIGALSVLMSPVSFLQQPFRWLQAVSRYRAHTSGGPNFAYDLCARKVTEEQRRGLDLSSWRIAFNGAEPTHHETMSRFAEVFETCGFRRQAFYPCYGLAEATLFVTGGQKDASYAVRRVSRAGLEENLAAEAAAGESVTLVGCGKPGSAHGVVIVDPATLAPCPPGRVGEIWVSGPSVARGYWDKPDETARTFEARLSSGGGPFLRTGDLGFSSEGELYFAGRLKDLIIIRGRNLHPQDIESTVQQAHEALRPGCGAAFSVDFEDEERLVIVQEVDRGLDEARLGELLAAVRQAVAAEHEVLARAIVLVRQGTILKTSSGKIRRRSTRSAYLERSLHVVAEWQDPGEEPEPPGELSVAARTPEAPLSQAAIRAILLSRLGARLGLPPGRVDARAPFDSYGLDSAQAATLMGEIAEALGMELSPILFWNYPTVGELSRYLAREKSGRAEASKAHRPGEA
jgi:acyl-CoA synthetase (AMP-forming)/AMP-acid ligase II/acyl carrier protein